MVRGVPMIVKCEWTLLKVENLNIVDDTIEDMLRNKPCNEHEYCMGPQYRNLADDTYLVTTRSRPRRGS